VRHRCTNICRGWGRFAQCRQKLGFQLWKIETHESAIAHHLAATDEQAFDVPVRAFGEQQLQGGYVRFDEFGRERIPIEHQEIGRRAGRDAPAVAAAGFEPKPTWAIDFPATAPPSNAAWIGPCPETTMFGRSFNSISRPWRQMLTHRLPDGAEGPSIMALSCHHDGPAHYGPTPKSEVKSVVNGL